MCEPETAAVYIKRAEAWNDSIARIAGIPDRFTNARMTDLDNALAKKMANAYDCLRAVILQGPNGSGKTHAACAWLRGTYLASGKVPVFRYIPDLLGEARQAIAESRYESWLDKYKEPRCLVLDDFAAIRQTDFAAETIMRIIDSRYSGSCTPTSITTDVPLQSIHEENARVSGRIWEQADVILLAQVRPERDVLNTAKAKEQDRHVREAFNAKPCTDPEMLKIASGLFHNARNG